MVGLQHRPTSETPQLPNSYPIHPNPAPQPAARTQAAPNNDSSLTRTIEVIDITDLPNGITPVSSQQPCQDPDEDGEAVQPFSSSAAVASQGIVVEPEGENGSYGHHRTNDEDVADRNSPANGVRSELDSRPFMRETEPDSGNVRSTARRSWSEIPTADPSPDAHDEQGILRQSINEEPVAERRAPELGDGYRR
ncbi:hypothetical protein GTA08_BOTSDO09303 [Botryosphaeria dothidea]|uniref:Uncharacterized protein n=1 Tax=Botryosphaeria dothidea TaxID=55169 RepID=A0A8H4ILY9_9PEZI|nr:hypothetical protein GTA08_BOTSDO09303 [Botryosphaeria dothidea]